MRRCTTYDRLTTALPVLIAYLLFTAPVEAESAFAIGAEYTRGDYGTGIETTAWKLPFGLEYRGQETLFSLTVPYLMVEGSAEVSGVRGSTFGGRRAGREQGGTQTGSVERSDGGIGDVLLRASYQFQRETPTRPWFGVTAKVKFGTADEKKNLGTGENDYALQFDAAKGPLDGVIGYRVIGDTDTLDFDNILYGAVGYRLRFEGLWSVRGEFYTEQRALDGVDPERELSLAFSRPLSPVRGIKLTLIKGFSDSSPDWGAGVALVSAF